MNKICLILFLITFTALQTSSKDFDFVVDQDGRGDFISVQEAINAVLHLRKHETKIFNGWIPNMESELNF